MSNKLEPGNETKITVLAKEYYSTNSLMVRKGELYQFSVNEKDKWIDWFIACSADGFRNIFLGNRFKRLPNIKCFTLCGTINKNEKFHFPIGIREKVVMPATGTLHFFANDSKKRKRYKNNKGQVTVFVKRLKDKI